MIFNTDHTQLSPWVIIVHEGVDPIRAVLMDPGVNGYQVAATAGWNVLQSDGTVLDAVQRAVGKFSENFFVSRIRNAYPAAL